MDPDEAGKALLGLRNTNNILTELPIDADRASLITTINALVREHNNREHFAPWRQYTPTTTNITMGDGSVTGWYKEIGTTVFFEVVLTFGTGTTFLAGTTYTTRPRISLPMKGKVNTWTTIDVPGDSGATMPAAIRMALDVSVPTAYNSTYTPQWYDENTFIDNGLNSTTPFTQAAGDKVIWSGAYEKAQ